MASCHTPRYVYSPAPPNVPYFTKKGDSKISGFYSGGEADGYGNVSNQGFDIQGAYAVTNHWAVILNYYNRTEKDMYNVPYNAFDSSSVRYKRNSLEVGIGYYVPLNRHKTITYNIYAGYGFGGFKINDTGLDSSRNRYSKYYNCNTGNFFIQGGFNFMPSRYFAFSLMGKISSMYYGYSQSSYTSQELKYFYLDKLNKRTLTFFEPTFNMQFTVPKCDWLKVEGSLTFSTNTPDYYPAARSFNGSIGLTIAPSKIFKSKY